MYMDIDSILFSNRNTTPAHQSSTAKHWVSRIDETVLTREDLCAIYGCWAEDAAESDFLDPEDGNASRQWSYAA